MEYTYAFSNADLFFAGLMVRGEKEGNEKGKGVPEMEERRGSGCKRNSTVLLILRRECFDFLFHDIYLVPMSRCTTHFSARFHGTSTFRRVQFYTFATTTNTVIHFYIIMLYQSFIFIFLLVWSFYYYYYYYFLSLKREGKLVEVKDTCRCRFGL